MAVKKIFLHIGIMKTGTTAIQDFLAANRKVLSRHGVEFPRMRIGPSHTYDLRNAHFLIHTSLAVDEGQKKQEEKQVWAGGVQMLEKALMKSDIVILTVEMLWYAQNRGKYRKRILSLMERLGCELKVIVYLRRQDEYVESYWNQKIKGNSRYTVTFGEYLDSEAYMGILPDYDAQLQEMCGIYGKENIIVRVYEPGQYEGGSLISDFLHQVGLELTEEYTFPEKESNLQISGNYIEMKRLINQLPDYKETDNFYRTAMLDAAEAVMAETGEMSEKTTMFSPGERIAFAGRFQEGNAWVAREFLQREDGILFRKPAEELPSWHFREELFCRDVMLTMAGADIYQQKKIKSANERLRQLRADYQNKTAALELQLLSAEEQITELKDELRVLKKEHESVYKSLIFRIYRKIRSWFKAGRP